MKLSAKIGLLLGVFTVFVVAVSGGVVYLLTRAAQPLATSWLVVAAVVIAALTAAIVWMLVRQITLPLQALGSAVNRIALGDLSQEISVQSNDEFGQLGRRFGEMTRQLSSSYRHLESTTEEARERHAELEASIESLKQGFVLINAKHDVLMANAAVGVILHGGKPAPQHQAHLTFADIVHRLPADLQLTEKVAQTLHEGKPAKYPNLPLEGRFLNLYLSPVSSGHKPIGCVLLVEDITEERIAARSRDEFFSIASHELRTPLTAIRGNTALLQQYYPKLMQDQTVRDMVTDVHESAVRLIEIVNDFLDASSLEQGKMKFTLRAFPLEPLIAKVIQEMAEVCSSKQVTIAFDAAAAAQLPAVFADTDRVTQIIYNLIGNAVKFTDHGTVRVYGEKHGNTVRVHVADTGIGISPEGQQILFHKFQQSADSILTRDNTRGTGLGLYISKLMVERMGGAIGLERSESGKGSTFSFVLPVATAAQLKSAAAPVSTAVAKQAV